MLTRGFHCLMRLFSSATASFSLSTTMYWTSRASERRESFFESASRTSSKYLRTAARRDVWDVSCCSERGKNRGGVYRFEESFKWDGMDVERWQRLGFVKEKQHERKSAPESYAKSLEIEPNAAEGPNLRMRLGKVH